MVFSAITAVGCMAHARARILVTDHALTQLKTDLKEEVALAQYCKASASLQKYIDAAVLHAARIEPVLICSLLFVLFETFRGEPSLASSHLAHGRRALESVVGQDYRLHDRQTSSSQDAVKELLLSFDVLDSGPLPPPSLLELQRYPSWPRFLGLNRIQLPRFATMSDAKHSLDSLVAETVRWRDELLVLAEDRLSDIKLDSWSVAARQCLKHCLSRSINISRHSTLLLRKNELLKAHEEWLQRLRDVSPDLVHDYNTLLQIQHFYSHFLILTSRETTHAACGSFDQDFRRALDLTERYLNHQGRVSVGPAKSTFSDREFTFSLEAGPLSVLFLISLQCCNKELRCRAMNLLHQANRREGLQWSGELSIYADCIVEFEETKAQNPNNRGDRRPLDWWFQRIPEAKNSPNLVIQGVGYHDIRIVGCRYLQEDCKEMKLLELRGAGMPPLHLKELSRTIIPTP